MPRQAWVRDNDPGFLRVVVCMGNRGALIQPKHENQDEYFVKFLLRYNIIAREYVIHGLNIDLVFVNQYEREFSLLILYYLKVVKNTPHVLKRRSTQSFVTFTLWTAEDDFDTVNVVNAQREKHFSEDPVKKSRILPLKSSVPLAISHEERVFDMRLRQIGSHYCKMELDYMHDEGWPALPFDKSMRNVDINSKRKRKLPDWAYMQ